MGTMAFKELILQRSGRLFAAPSFLTGFSRALDVGATFDDYNQDDLPHEADYGSLWSDWYAVGDDLRYALELYRLQNVVESV